MTMAREASHGAVVAGKGARTTRARAEGMEAKEDITEADTIAASRVGAASREEVATKVAVATTEDTTAGAAGAARAADSGAPLPRWHRSRRYTIPF